MTDLAAEMLAYHVASLVGADAGMKLCERLGIAPVTHSRWQIGEAHWESAGGDLWESAGPIHGAPSCFTLPVCDGGPLDSEIIDILAFDPARRSPVLRRSGHARMLGSIEPEDDAATIRLVGSPLSWLREGEARAAEAELRAAAVSAPFRRHDWFWRFHRALVCILDWREMQPHDLDGIGRLVCDDEAHAALVHAELEKCWRRGRLAPRPKVWVTKGAVRQAQGQITASAGLRHAVAASAAQAGGG